MLEGVVVVTLTVFKVQQQKKAVLKEPIGCLAMKLSKPIFH